MRKKYSAIDSWNELIGTCYGAVDKIYIETILEWISLGMIEYIPSWTIIRGGAGTGKSTLIDIICRLFPSFWIPVAYDSVDFGQYSNTLAIDHDCPIEKLYKNVKENWSMSKDTKFILSTNHWPDDLGELINEEDILIIEATGDRIPIERYIELYKIIMDGIDELSLYFKARGYTDFINRSL